MNIGTTDIGRSLNIVYSSADSEWLRDFTYLKVPFCLAKPSNYVVVLFPGYFHCFLTWPKAFQTHYVLLLTCDLLKQIVIYQQMF